MTGVTVGPITEAAVLAPGDFVGTLPGLEYPVTDPEAWTDKLVKAHPPVTTSGRPVQTAILPPLKPTPIRKVTLTQAEREWLGASVRLVNRPGAVWQVWALHPKRGRVWIVREGVYDDQLLSNLERVS